MSYRIGRREFLAGVAATGAAALLPDCLEAQQTLPPPTPGRRIIDVHLTGTFLVLKHTGRQMISQRSGSIIVSSTVDALVGCAGLDSYTAAKGGVTSMVRSCAPSIMVGAASVDSPLISRSRAAVLSTSSTFM